MAQTSPSPTIGHVHLRVADIDRALGFYRDLRGLSVTARFGTEAAFLASGGYHHHLGLNTWHSMDACPPPPGHTGLYHAAILYRDRVELAQVTQRVVAAGYTLDGAADHGVSQAVYLRDPDGNGVELYFDRPPADWPRDPDGALAFKNERLDVEARLNEAPTQT